MKKFMSLCVVAGLSMYSIGCGGGDTVDAPAPEPTEAEMAEMDGAMDIAGEGALAEEAPAEAAPAE